MGRHFVYMLAALCLLSSCLMHCVTAREARGLLQSSFGPSFKHKSPREGKLGVRSRREDVSRVLSIRGGASLAAIDKTSGVKIGLQLLLTALNAVCWGVPLASKKFSQNEKLLSIANSFAGGIFLMLGLGHLVPHSMEIFESLHLDTSNTFKCVISGYLLVLFLNKIAFGGVGHDHSHSEAGAAEQPVKGTLSDKAAIVLLVAVSMHSLFETMALGLAQDSTTAAIMAASVGLHQPAESLAILIAFLKTSMSVPTIVKWLAAYSSVGIVGVLLGILIKTVSPPFVDAVVVGVTAGTFLYLGATEIVSEEFEESHGMQRFVKFGALVTGIVSIAFITQVTERWEHGHHH